MRVKLRGRKRATYTGAGAESGAEAELGTGSELGTEGEVGGGSGDGLTVPSRTSNSSLVAIMRFVLCEM